jgi:hypothetical protein
MSGRKQAARNRKSPGTGGPDTAVTAERGLKPQSTPGGLASDPLNATNYSAGMVELRGIEPLTSSLRTRRSPN